MTRDSTSERGESATNDEETTRGVGRFDRRDYLRVLGSASAAGLLGSASSGAATAQSGFDEAAADQRIRENQAGPLTVEVVDEDGAPVSGATVEVQMQEHDFGFGTAIKIGDLLDRFDEGSQFYEHLRELFNTAVLENAHKWAQWENNRQRADEAVDWLDRNGFRIRGHTCVYGVDYAIPSDVMQAVNSGDGQTVRERSMQHLRDIITHYGDTVQEWDVVNEAVHRGILQSGVYPDRVNPDDPASSELKPWTSPLLADWYSEAESVIEENDLDVEICTNDYNTLTWAQDSYAEQVRYLDQQGIDVDVMGHQGHIGPTNSSNQPWTYATINQVFERFADLPATQRITEFDMTGDSWEGQQQRADVLRQFLKTAYGHPDVEDFVIWGMWDQTHWRSEAPFFYSDWSEKPAVDVWRNLVFDEWWTEESGTTDGSGTYSVDAFLGEHEVTVSTDRGSVTQTVSVTDADAGQQVTVTVDTGGDDGPPAIEDGEAPPTDPDGDGLYEDLNGNGEADYADVVTYFDNMEDPSMTDHAAYYDYNGNGEVDFADLVDLFGQVN